MTLEACNVPSSYTIQLTQFEGGEVSEHAKEESKHEISVNIFLTGVCESYQIYYKGGVLIPKNITRQLMVNVSATAF